MSPLEVTQNLIDHGIEWFNDSLKRHRQNHFFICDLYKMHRTDNLLNLRNQSRHNYNKAISAAKIRASSNYIGNSSNKAKAVWTVIGSVKSTNKKQTSKLDPNVINKHFVEHPHRIVGELPAAVESPLDMCIVPAGAAVGFSLSKVSSVIVRGLLMGLKTSTTKDIYGISTKFIKNNISLYVPLLVKLINSAIDTGEFPDLLKKAYVIPVYKTGSPDDAANYRPISILPVFSKLYERVIYNQIVDHFELNNIFSPHQFGFRVGKSTEDAVVAFSNCCLEAFDRGEYCVTMLLDLSRAFDCVSHSVLLDKLRRVYGFDRMSLKLIESYLSNRCQRVQGDSGVSEFLDVSRGVAQGSIIGPIMFLIFFNDFYFYLKESFDVDCFLYADDATVTIRGPTFADVMAKSDEVLNGARRWAIANQLSLNEEKTVRLAFGLRKFNFDGPECCKLLGVCITPPSLGFEEHARVTGAKMARNIFLLRRLATAVTADVLRTAYFALVHCHTK